MRTAPQAERRAFTLIEVLAVLLILVLGLGSVVALIAVGRRQGGTAQMRLTGAHTALSVVHDAAPAGLTADAGDADGDGWAGSGAVAWTGAYTLESRGQINGFWVRRQETSTPADILSARQRFAQVTVEVFWGAEGAYVTTVQERILREGAP